jgi:hypothetical protein
MESNKTIQNQTVAVIRAKRLSRIVAIPHLPFGGRFQEDVSSDVEAKLKEITADPKTVGGAITLNGTSPAPTK